MFNEFIQRADAPDISEGEYYALLAAGFTDEEIIAGYAWEDGYALS